MRYEGKVISPVVTNCTLSLEGRGIEKGDSHLRIPLSGEGRDGKHKRLKGAGQ